MALDSVWGLIQEAIAEIAAIFLLVDTLLAIQFISNLNRAYYTHQITGEVYLIRLVVQFFLVPAIPAIVIGIIIHFALERRGV